MPQFVIIIAKSLFTFVYFCSIIELWQRVLCRFWYVICHDTFGGKEMKRKTIFILLVLVLCMALVPAAAYAQVWSGNTYGFHIAETEVHAAAVSHCFTAQQSCRM